MISLDITVTEKAQEYIAKASEIITKNNGKPALAIWTERIRSWGGSRIEINIDLYSEKEILNADGFENKGNINEINIPLYIQKTAYPYLSEKLVIGYSGFMFKKLYLTDYTPVRFQGRC